MQEQIITNLTLVISAMGILTLAWLSNFSFSIYFNIKILKHIFDMGKLIKGMEKIIVLCLGVGLLTTVITLFPIFIVYVGIPIGEEYTQIFNIATIIVLFGDCTIRYVKQAYETLKGILEQ